MNNNNNNNNKDRKSNMIKLDKIKIVTKAEYININDSIGEWRDNKKNGIKSFVYNQKQPFNLFLQITPCINKAVLEFSSKILYDEYIELINVNTIRTCLENVAKTTLCNLQIEDIINDSIVINCDVTCDITLEINCDVKMLIISQIKNLNKYHVQKYTDKGYTITKQVKTKKCQIRLSIYDKYKEMLKASNSIFLDSCIDGMAILNYFEGKYRIETNLKTLNQIREFCNVDNTNLLDVLKSDSNILVKIFDIIFENNMQGIINNSSDTKSIFEYNSINELRDTLLLEKCENDLEIIDKVINHYYAKRTNKRKIRAHFNKLRRDELPISANKLIIKEIRDNLINLTVL